MKKIAFLICLAAALIGYVGAQPLVAQAPEQRSRPEREALDASAGWVYQAHADLDRLQSTRSRAPAAPNNILGTWSRDRLSALRG